MQHSQETTYHKIKEDLFYLYIDEFQNFSTPTITQILSEARKYNLALIVANQFLAQIKNEIKDSVLGNVGTSITFRVGFEDAEKLHTKFGDEVKAQELAETENLNCIVSMLANGKLLSPFTMKIRHAPKGSDEVKKIVSEYSKLKTKA